jgi:hypothetical protein
MRTNYSWKVRLSKKERVRPKHKKEKTREKKNEGEAEASRKRESEKENRELVENKEKRVFIQKRVRLRGPS